MTSLPTWGWNVDVDSDGVLMLVQKVVQASLDIGKLGVDLVTGTLHIHLSERHKKSSVI